MPPKIGGQNVVVNVGASFILQNDFEVMDSGVRFHFLAPDPGPNLPSDWYVFFTYSEWDGLTNQQQIDSKFTDRLNQQVRGTQITNKVGTLFGKAYII